MKKKLKIILICGLLIGSGLAAFLVFAANPWAKTNSAGRDLDRLFEKMGVVKIQTGGDPIDVRLPDLNGINVGLSDFRGKIVFLNFWATWCPTCVTEMPAMEKLHQKLRNKDFAMVAVSIQDSAARVKNFFKEKKLTFTALLDSTGEIGAGFGLRVIPTTIIIDKTGKAIGIVMGPREWDSRESITLFEHLAAEAGSLIEEETLKKQILKGGDADETVHASESSSLQQRLPSLVLGKTQNCPNRVCLLSYKLS